jgi:catechol 2,3-dioxygenase
MTEPVTTRPRLTLGHTTLAVRDVDAMVAFYRDVLGFHVTNRGEPGPGAAEMAFLSQDPSAHHQIVMVGGAGERSHDFVLADHLAFRTGTLDDLRVIRDALQAAGVELIPIDHGNSWSLYFTDPEGNGLECFVDTPFHVAQPFADALDLSRPDDELVAATRARIESEPEFGPVDEWRSALEATLDARTIG